MKVVVDSCCVNVVLFRTEYDWCHAIRAKKKPRFDGANRGLRKLLVAFLLTAIEQFSDSEGEEGGNSKVDDLLFTLVLKDQGVSWLDQRTSFRIIYGLR